MRKHFVITLLCVLGLMPDMKSELQAQWRVGVLGGATYNEYAINIQYQTDYRYAGAWGWSAAVFGQYDFLDWIGLRAEVEATERNYRFYRTGIYSGTHYTYRNTYLQLPVMAQFSFGGQQVRGFVNTGVYVGDWAAGQQKGSSYDPMSNMTFAVDEPYIFQSDKDQRVDFGLAGGLGIEYRPAEHWALHLEGRCYYGLVSTVKQYMHHVKDYRYNTTLGANIGVAYIF